MNHNTGISYTRQTASPGSKQFAEWPLTPEGLQYSHNKDSTTPGMEGHSHRLQTCLQHTAGFPTCFSSGSHRWDCTGALHSPRSSSFSTIWVSTSGVGKIRLAENRSSCGKYYIYIYIYIYIYRSFATTVLQLKSCDFSGETFKGFEVL